MDADTGMAGLADQTSQVYLHRWSRLVSTTNWEKGRIIHDWRAALIGAEAPVEEYSDEAWARRVGQVSGQHVGRLRRCYERFHPSYESYAGLYWSHFQAALDWEDAELWLEGAVQNQWSVALMRRQRGITLGEIAADAASEESNGEQGTDATANHSSAPWDEDAEVPASAGPITGDLASQPIRPGKDASAAGSERLTSGPLPEGPDFGPEDFSETGAGGRKTELTDTAADSALTIAAKQAAHRPFADLPTLPDDLAEAFENLKLAILRHKTQDWQFVQPSEVRAHLRAFEDLLSLPG
ncbi:MAG: hypothetical protein SFX18_12770 [Pirellulales bacterium]|nr:hypothetical protein [Pirellulales bacterium]